MTYSKKEVWKVWIAAVLWLGLIVTESSNLGSSSNTSRYLYPLLHYLFGMGHARFEVWHPILRKTGHFVGYFTLSVLLFRAWRATLPVARAPRWAFRWAEVSWLMTALVASLDEWHQSYLASRTGNFRDVLLDSFAGLVAQVMLWLWLRQGKASRSDTETRSLSTAK